MDDITKPQVLPISRLYVPDESEVDESVRPILEQNKRQNGYLENWIISLALNPGTLKRAIAYFQSLFDPNEGQLTPVERELIAVVVSAENGCAYCETHHTKGLAHALKDPIRARRIAAGYDHVPDLTPREKALADLAIKITRDPATVTDTDVNGLRYLGLDDKVILEVIETAAFFNYTNRVGISINNIPEDQLFIID
jgi:uncharacterized peroxidase-related enzyme